MPPRRIPSTAVLGVYMAAVLVAATLVILVQPMAARLLLPRLGGSPAVSTTSILLFQAALLVGYGWAHLSTTRFWGSAASPLPSWRCSWCRCRSSRSPHLPG